MTKVRNLIGETFGRLKVIARAKDIKGDRRWDCICSCGRFKDSVSHDNLIAMRSTSCGCKRSESIKKAIGTHGESATPLYLVWRNMVSRCTNPKRSDYKRYGGRGITVCERWRKYENFLADMGRPPSPSHSLERIENNKGYGPDNCKWATNIEQANNKRRTVLLTLNGITKPITIWCRELNINYATSLYRFHRGLSAEEILSPEKRPSHPVS